MGYCITHFFVCLFIMSVWYLFVMRPICAEWFSLPAIRSLAQSISQSREVGHSRSVGASNLQLETARCGRKVAKYSELDYSCVSCCRQHGVSADEGAFAVRSPASVSSSEERCPGSRARGPVARGTQEEAGFPRSRRGSWGGFKPPTRQHRRSSPQLQGRCPPSPTPPFVSGSFDSPPFPSPTPRAPTIQRRRTTSTRTFVRPTEGPQVGLSACVRAVWLG